MSGIGVSAVTAYTAHREWASRPPDERYASVNALYQAARARRDRTEARDVDADTANDRTVVLRATRQELGPNRDAVLEGVVQRLDLSQKQAAEAYTLASSTSQIPVRSGATHRD